MSTVDALLDGSLREAVAAVAAGQITAGELTLAARARIESSPAMESCFLRKDFKTIPASTAGLGSGDGSPKVSGAAATGLLAGIPVAHKDIFSWPGRASTFAAHPDFHRTGDEMARALALLDAAGAVNFGALHLSEFAMGPAGWSEHAGFIDNPVSPGFVTGGSSSGSAALVAHRAVFAALGTDTGGSIRIPAAFCGVVGLKPSHDLVSLHGVHPVSPSLDTVGPIARTVDDCARLLDVLTQAPGHAQSGPFEDAACTEPGRLRIGWVSPNSLPAVPDPQMLALYEKTVGELRRIGVDMHEVQLPDWTTLNTLAGLVFTSEAAAVHLRALQQGPERIGPQVRKRLEHGLTHTASLYISALNERQTRRAALQQALFGQVDVLAAPVSPCLAPERRWYAGRDTDSILAFNARVGAYTAIFNYLGMPALSMPVARADDGRFFALQLAAETGCDAGLLQAAGALARALHVPGISVFSRGYSPRSLR